MKLKITIVRLGGGFQKAIIGQHRDTLTGGWNVDSVFGADDAELLMRLKIRLPVLKTRPLGRFA